MTSILARVETDNPVQPARHMLRDLREGVLEVFVGARAEDAEVGVRVDVNEEDVHLRDVDEASRSRSSPT